MSPYMEAYEAGAKLAQVEYRSKIANPEEAYEQDGYFGVPEDAGLAEPSVQQLIEAGNYENSGDPAMNPYQMMEAPPPEPGYLDRISNFFTTPEDDIYSPASRMVSNAALGVSDAFDRGSRAIGRGLISAGNSVADFYNGLSSSPAEAATLSDDDYEQMGEFGVPDDVPEYVPKEPVSQPAAAPTQRAKQIIALSPVIEDAPPAQPATVPAPQQQQQQQQPQQAQGISDYLSNLLNPPASTLGNFDPNQNQTRNRALTDVEQVMRTPRQQQQAAPQQQQQPQQAQGISDYLSNLLNPPASTLGNFDPNQNQTRNRALTDVEQVMRTPRQQQQAAPAPQAEANMSSAPPAAPASRTAPSALAQQAEPAQKAAPRFGAPSMTRGGSNLFNTQLGGIDPSLVAFGNRPQTESSAPVQQAPNMSSAQQAEPNMSMPQAEPNMSMPQAEPNMSSAQQAEPNMSMPQAEPNMSMPGQQAAQPQAAPTQQAPRFDYQAVNQDGMVDQDARFNVQAGNYRKQFNRFREQFGEGQGDAFKGLTYKDFAGALGNRGLRVGDSLSANDIMTRLQGIREDNYNREQGTPIASRGAGLDPLEIQNRRGNVANRGSLAAQRAAAQRAGAQRAEAERSRLSQGTNMPQARPGQFANTQLNYSPMQAPVQSPQLSLGSNRPGIGTGGFYNPQSAAKPSPSGLNMGGDFRLNTPKQVRPFDQYED